MQVACRYLPDVQAGQSLLQAVEPIVEHAVLYLPVGHWEFPASVQGYPQNKPDSFCSHSAVEIPLRLQVSRHAAQHAVALACSLVSW